MDKKSINFSFVNFFLRMIFLTRERVRGLVKGYFTSSCTNKRILSVRVSFRAKHYYSYGRKRAGVGKNGVGEKKSH
jgi:hypothetical protein